MMKRRKKAAARDMLMQGELPFLWADENGLLKLPPQSLVRSNGLQSPRLRLSPRGAVAKASRYLRLRSLSSWLGSKSSGAFGFGAARESLFEMWLSARLENSAFNALELWRVLEDAKSDLALEKWEAVRLLIRTTRKSGKFKSDGGLVTFR